MRKILAAAKIHPDALNAMNSFHSNVVQEVQDTVSKEPWVIVGMNQNPVVKNARNLLDSKGIAYTYIAYGNYFSKWKERLAIKLWSGWPTFPQVFHKGVLIGGFKDLKPYLEKQ